MGPRVLFHQGKVGVGRAAPGTPTLLTNSVMCQTQSSKRQTCCQMNPMAVSLWAAGACCAWRPPAVGTSDERVGVHGVLDLLRLQRRRQLQRQQRLHHVVAMRRWRALAAGALSHLAVVEEVGALDDEGLDDCLVQLRGGQRLLVLKVRSHQSGPEADGQVVGSHQDGLAVLADPGTGNNHIQEADMFDWRDFR